MSRVEELTLWLAKEIEKPNNWNYENKHLIHKDTLIKITEWWNKSIQTAVVKCSPCDFGDNEKSIVLIYSGGFNDSRLNNLLTQVEARQNEETAEAILRATEIPF